MLHELLALVAPPACGVCGDGCEVGRRICESCERALWGLPPVRSSVPVIDETWSAAPYEGAARQLVGAVKFRSMVGLADVAAALIAVGVPDKLLHGAIVPVPAAPARRRRRGFDAAEALAAALARRCGLPIAPCLARSESARQVGRRRVERVADPPCVRAVAPPPREPLLVDDVMTTGATLGACAAVLRAAGAARVAAVTLAVSRPAARRLGQNARAA
jgi:ComF family protein